MVKQSSEWPRNHRPQMSVFLREALFTLRLAKQNLGNPVLLLLLRKVITFCEEDLMWGTGPVRLGSLTHDFEAGPKMTRL